jgi:hypothetical protein
VNAASFRGARRSARAAKAREAAFPPLRKKRKQPAAAPDCLTGYLRTARYLAALRSMLATPTVDDPDAKTRDLCGHATENLIIEHFEDVRAPASMADKKSLRARRDYLERRAKGENPDASDEAEMCRIAKAAPKVSLREVDIASFAKALSGDPAANKLLCRE